MPRQLFRWNKDLTAKIDKARDELLAAGNDDEEWDDFEILQEHVTSIGKVPLIFQIDTQGGLHGRWIADFDGLCRTRPGGGLGIGSTGLSLEDRDMLDT